MESNEINRNDNQNHETNKSISSSMRIWVIMITIILALSLIVNVYLLIQNINENQRKTELIQLTDRFLIHQENIINLMALDYEEKVYNDQNIESIYQQIFRSQEFTYEAITLLANQNNFLIKLIADMP